MADNYSQFSEELTRLTDEEMAWLGEVLTTDPGEPDGSHRLSELLGADLAAEGLDDTDAWPGFVYELDRKKRWLWFHSGEGYEEAPLVWILRAFLCRFRPEEAICISIAHTCSAPRIGQFGGGWLRISAGGVAGGNTWDSAKECP